MKLPSDEGSFLFIFFGKVDKKLMVISFFNRLNEIIFMIGKVCFFTKIIIFAL